jgi:mono/diheme cytochrome c family protein
MQNKVQIYFWSLMVISAVVLVIFQMNSRPPVPDHVVSGEESAEMQQVMALYSKNCARCHGAFGQGFAANPKLAGRNIPVPMIKSLVQKGKNKMPAFPEIQEPILTKLAEYVSTF